MTPAVRFAPPDAKPVKWNKRKKKTEESSAGHHFYWQLVNKLKKRDAEASPHPLPLSSVADNWCSPPSPRFFSWKWWTFQVLELVEGLYITPFHSMLAFWVLPQRGEIPWAGKLSSWTINHGLELIFDSKLWWGTLNRAGLPADTWIESLKVQHARRRGDEGLFVFTGPAKSC